MSEYTFENVIINPATEGIEQYIGKKVYFGNTIVGCLSSANTDARNYLGILAEVHPGFNFPFRIGRFRNDGCYYDDCDYICFIPKKEDPKPEHTPFETRSQFLDAYMHHRGKDSEDASVCQLADLGGIWLKSLESNFYVMVTEICDNGAAIRQTCEVTPWSEIYKDFVFLDNTPCGELKGTVIHNVEESGAKSAKTYVSSKSV